MKNPFKSGFMSQNGNVKAFYGPDKLNLDTIKKIHRDVEDLKKQNKKLLKGEYKLSKLDMEYLESIGLKVNFKFKHRDIPGFFGGHAIPPPPDMFDTCVVEISW